MSAKPSSTHKRVVVETFDGNRFHGYLNPRNFDRPDGLEMLDLTGQALNLSWSQVKLAWFVRDWDVPPRPQQTTFSRRPRLEGLWVRLRFRDDEILEGILVNDLTQQSDHGFLLTPPDLDTTHQRVFVPRAALTSLEVVGVIRGGEPRRRRRATPADEGRQPSLFNE